MANNPNQPDPQQQAEYNRYAEIGRRLSAQFTEESRNLNQELRDQLGLRQRQNDFDKALLSISRQITQSAQENRVEVGRAGQIQKQLTKDAQTLSDAERERLIASIGLNSQQIADAETIALKQQRRLETFNRINELQERYNQASDSEKITLAERIKRNNDLLAIQEENLNNLLSSVDAETERLALANQLVQTANRNSGASRAEAVIQSKISNATGVTGAALQGAAGFMQKLGMNSNIFNDSIKEAQDAMNSYADEQIRATGSVSKISVLMKGLGPLAKGFGKALLDPLTILLKIVDGFFDVNKAAVEYTRLSGQNATAIAGLNSRLATSVDFLQTAAELTRQTGLAATGIFGPGEIAAMAEAKNLLGLSAEQAGNLGMRSKVAGVNIDQYKEGIVAATNSYNKTNKSVVAHGVVLQDVLNTSDEIALSLGGNPKSIAAAASAARSLGMELSKVDAIAGSLMDFESSIQNELEAQLLTGKSINLSKARELALNNDLEGLAKELSKNGASAAEFAKMNRIQQESLAKALGMSRDDLGKMAQQQLLAAGASLEQQAAARGVTVEQMEQMNVQDRIQKSLDKLAQAFAPILDAVVPIVEMLASVLQPLAMGVGYVSQLLGGFLKIKPVAIALQAAVAGVAIAFGAMKLISGAGQIVSFFSSLTLATIKDTLAKWANIGATAAQTASTAAQTAANTTLAASQTAVATTSAPLAGGLAAAGAALGAFGTAAAPAIPVILSIGAAALMAGAGVWLLSKGLVSIFEAITLDKAGAFAVMAGGLILLGPGLISTAAGLISLSAAALLALPGLGALGALTLMGPGLTLAANGVAVMAENISRLAAALNSLELEKLSELKSLVITTAFAAPMVAATGAITSLIQGLAGTNSKEGSSNTELLAKIDELISVVRQGGDVYIDGNKAGQALVLGSYKSS